jgi:hypothetical protein
MMRNTGNFCIYSSLRVPEKCFEFTSTGHVLEIHFLSSACVKQEKHSTANPDELT